MNKPTTTEPKHAAFKAKTKSNYRDLNGKWLHLKEVHKTRVSAIIFDDEIGKDIITDFNLSEVVKFNHITF